MIRTFEINKTEIDEEDPWSGILAAVMFATRATYHTTLKATPSQLIFGRDAILNTKFEANWKAIKENKQRCIHVNNKNENRSRILHRYNKGDQVLYKELQTNKFRTNPHSGPYTICKVNKNGTILIKMGVVLETINIRLIKPYNR